MDLFVDGKLNPYAFEMDVRYGTHDLNDILLAAVKTQSAAIESTHFLIALPNIPNGETRKKLARLALPLEQWGSGLASCVEQRTGGVPLAHLTESALHNSAVTMLHHAQQLCDEHQTARISEPILLLSALENLTKPVIELCRDADLDVAKWRAELESLLKPPPAVQAFNPDETIALSVFSPGAKKVLALLRSETESLGYESADPRHLLLALLAHDGGVLPYGLYHQGASPRKVQEAVMLSLRNKARRTRSIVTPDRAHLQPILQRILELAGELASRDRADRLTEPHLLRAFLGIESTALRILQDEKIKLADLGEIAEGYDTSLEEEEDEDTMADISTVRERLKQRLVGQDDAIERILPYVQRMRFGFTTPDRPVGVFLFCGQSGSGKTEMAKELARAIYGSEDNLIFLEMGQFNSRESINIFVGAPPGYIGYGEGKLTNGLRDKPRSVVLFDEVEKALEPKVLDALLRFLDEGKIDDPAGPVRDGTQCIIVLTSNAGAKQLSQLWKEVKDQPDWRDIVRKNLREVFEREHFRIEFLNRVDELILFRTLEQADYADIARRLLERHLERLKRERQIAVELDRSVVEAIGQYCARLDEGARAAQRLTQSVVITPVINYVLSHACPLPVRLRVSVEPTSQEGEPIGLVKPV